MSATLRCSHVRAAAFKGCCCCRRARCTQDRTRAQVVESPPPQHLPRCSCPRLLPSPILYLLHACSIKRAAALPHWAHSATLQQVEAGDWGSGEPPTVCRVIFIHLSTLSCYFLDASHSDEDQYPLYTCDSGGRVRGCPLLFASAGSTHTHASCSLLPPCALARALSTPAQPAPDLSTRAEAAFQAQREWRLQQMRLNIPIQAPKRAIFDPFRHFHCQMRSVQDCKSA